MYLEKSIDKTHGPYYNIGNMILIKNTNNLGEAFKEDNDERKK